MDFIFFLKNECDFFTTDLCWITTRLKKMSRGKKIQIHLLVYSDETFFLQKEISFSILTFSRLLTSNHLAPHTLVRFSSKRYANFPKKLISFFREIGENSIKNFVKT